MSSIGFIGLGAMGSPMAQQVLKKNGSLTVYDISDDAIANLVELGAKKAESPCDVGRNSEVVIMMLPHPDVLKNVVLGEVGLINSMKKGSVLIDMSTNGLKAVQSIASALKEKGVFVIDAPVGKGPWAAEQGDLTIMSGGDKLLCEKLKPILKMMGSKVYYCGALGSGQVIKLANNLASCANMAVAAEAYLLAKKGGADLKVLTEIMPQTSADSWQIRKTLNEKVLQGDFSPMFKLKLALKDMRLIVDMAKQLGTDLGCAKTTLAMYETADRNGHGEKDWGAIILNDNPELG